MYELLRRRCRDVEGEGAANDSRGEDAAAAAKRIRDSERAMLPFEGRLLVFWRGNGVEETRGRLLLKKLDYLQVYLGGGSCGGMTAVVYLLLASTTSPDVKAKRQFPSEHTKDTT